MTSFRILIVSLSVSLICACSSKKALTDLNQNPCANRIYDYSGQLACDGQTYPDPTSSPYVLPFPVGRKVMTGLTNCSSSFHGAQYPDRLAYDFNVKEGTPFYASRGGKVALVIDDQPSGGGGDKAGNWVVIDHLDNTFGIYLHSPKNGIGVKEGDTIRQGDRLGIVGKSGYAGYPHLHFIVVKDGYSWPYDPIPITFSNVYPADVVLREKVEYTVCDY